MSKRTRKPTLKLRESLQPGADEFWLSGEDEDIVLSGTADCWVPEDIDLKYVDVLCLCRRCAFKVYVSVE